jgi:hypothetical protein
MATFSFDRVSASDVGEWMGEENRAAEYMNDVLDELARQASVKFPNPTETQREAIDDLGKRFIFEDLCNDSRYLEHTGADHKAYVTSLLLNYVEEEDDPTQVRLTDGRLANGPLRETE